ncbi:N1221-domain-containing protein [Venturia nashicola]|uniref:N1221-domain-containing protein n=1 Tax=Venturia nashicola TaxID=86259 RepID=A0A4Z1PC67_9PEZI|nr:N1221-domain-containing protein [Venturia nashicola]
MDAFSDADEANQDQSLQQLAEDLDMILPPSEMTHARSIAENTRTTTETVERLLDEPSQPMVPAPIGGRPPLRREASAPPPSQPPPPAPAPPEMSELSGNPPESLSLMQLRRLVTEMPKIEPAPYAFTYQDAATLPEEVEEWFAYSNEEKANILRAQSSFDAEWRAYNNRAFTGDQDESLDWRTIPLDMRREYMSKLVEGLQETELAKRLRQLEALVYLCLGCWKETAGLKSRNYTHSASSSFSQPTASPDTTDSRPSISPQKQREKAVKAIYSKSGVQLDWLKTNTLMLFEIKALQPIFDVVRDACLRECSPSTSKSENNAMQIETERRETWCVLTIFYVCLEVARATEDETERLALRAQIMTLEPNLLIFLGDIINKLRWDPSIRGVLQRTDPREQTEKGPSAKLLLLTWKSVLVCLGGLPEVEKAKDSFQDPRKDDEEDKGPTITASPLDYHSFRQEISSKYPAYNPPPAYFPMEPESKSMLPPLRVNPSKPASTTVPGQPAQHGTSILHQPVHIATPAPSPPPSPQVGKGGKKQNYQTNNLFPFFYPPLDESSNQIGGKGSTTMQDVLVGRKWQGSDIPTSILEAAELFSGRMVATRALKQLWEERVEFMKFERGWTGAEDDEDVRPMKLESSEEEKKADESPKNFDGSVTERLQAVENFYRDGLPHLQSIVMVLMKTILANVTSLITQSTAAQSGVQGSFHFQQENATGTQNKIETNGFANEILFDVSKLGNDELDKMRGEEIAAKAVTGLLLLMLKWFKVSHVLKFEYLTQLLVDANYIPMVLKLLQTQEIEKIVNYKCENEDYNFFHYCRSHSRLGLQEDNASPAVSDSSSEEDEAAPPPIRRRRDEEDNQAHPEPMIPPTVDELGIPTTALPSEPITNFSWRNFYSSINFLRILQKVCKRKAHRALMLITYKSITHLKKSLKVPQPELRLYTLKLFKNQVPYCGRKWRQSNMRVITAVYLHCRPTLRDDWLSTQDMDQEIEQAVPMEQSLRSLTHWFNLRRWPEGMGAVKGVLKEEQDFFWRELDKSGGWEAMTGLGLPMRGSLADESDGGWGDGSGIDGMQSLSLGGPLEGW